MGTHIIYLLENPMNLLLSFDSNGEPTYTDNELDAMVFESKEAALYCIENQLNPSGTEFWGTRPTRPR